MSVDTVRAAVPEAMPEGIAAGTATEEQRWAFAVRLKSARERAGLTQEELAKKLEVTVWAIRHWEKADYIPRIRTYARKVARFILDAEKAEPVVKPKRWSRHYAACRVCGTTVRKHFGQGYCSTCYGPAMREVKAAE